MERKAIHFGVQGCRKRPTSEVIDGCRDANFYHQLAQKKGFESQVQTSDQYALDFDSMKRAIRDLAVDSETGNQYFISLTADSSVHKSRFGFSFVKRNFNKHLVLADNSAFGRRELAECLSYFSPRDMVFFLVTDLGVEKKEKSFIKSDVPKLGDKIKTQAAILSLTLKQKGLKEKLFSPLSSDIDYVLNGAKCVKDLLSNIQAIHGDNSVVQSELFCYNLAEENKFFINN